jgi:hypothetical protein
MRYWSTTLCVLLLVGCTEPTKPRVIVKTVVIEKPVSVSGDKHVFNHQCPTDIEKWQEHCKAIKNRDDCNNEDMCIWHGKSQMRCQRMQCKDNGLPWPR